MLELEDMTDRILSSKGEGEARKKIMQCVRDKELITYRDACAMQGAGVMFVSR
jgi:hypothetical protein